MSAILMTVEAVRTRATTQEALLTLAVPLEQAALISRFLSMIGRQVGVAFADVTGKPLVDERDVLASEWSKLPALTQSAISLCKEERFQKFVVERRGHSSELPSEKGAASYIKAYCKVETRKDLERVDGARERFGALMAEYRAWLQS